MQFSKHELKLASPSNLLIAGLFAFLLAGYGTDWKIVFGSSKQPKPPARFGASEAAVGPHRTRQLRMGRVPASDSDSNSQVADNRP